MSELEQFKDQHGRLIYTNKIGFQNTLFGYIREINSDHIIFQDNEKPDKFKVRNIISFTPVKLPEWKNY